MSEWKNKIVKHGEMPADQFLANPRNPRIHPEKQRKAMKGSLDALGWISPVIVNRNTGYLIDGHERVWQALRNDNASVPYVEVDLSEEEEATALASFDFITYLAEYDRNILDDLLQDVSVSNAELDALLEDMSQTVAGIESDSELWSSAFDSLPDSDRSPYQQMTFTLHDDQVETVKEAISLASSIGDYGNTGNENNNGNALARICEVFITQNGQR